MMLFYQFYDSRYLDLATAVGKRRIIGFNYSHLFFPQLLYNIKLKKGYTIGGSLVNVITQKENQFLTNNQSWRTFDISIFIPIINSQNQVKLIDEIKLGVGLFKSGLDKDYPDKPFLPTYSLDIKFERSYKSK